MRHRPQQWDENLGGFYYPSCSLKSRSRLPPTLFLRRGTSGFPDSLEPSAFIKDLQQNQGGNYIETHTGQGLFVVVLALTPTRLRRVIPLPQGEGPRVRA